MEKLMTYKFSVMIPVHYILFFVLAISIPLIAQEQEEVKKEDRTVTKTSRDGLFEDDSSTAMFDDIFSDIQ